MILATQFTWTPLQKDMWKLSNANCLIDFNLLYLSLRYCIPGVPGCAVLWALHHSPALCPGGHFRLQKGKALCCGILALLSAVDTSSVAGLEQLWARGARHHMLGPVAPTLCVQCLIRVVSVHLLPLAAPPPHGLLLWTHPLCYQEGKLDTLHNTLDNSTLSIFNTYCVS